MADPVLGPVTDGDTFKVIIFQMLYNQRIMNVLHYVCTDAGATPPDRFQVCRDLATNMTGAGGLLENLGAVQSNDLKHLSLRVQFLKEIDSTYPFYEEPLTSTGAVVTAAKTANVAVSIEKRADVPPTNPRWGIGRMAVAGIPLTGYDGGVLLPLYKADFNNLLDSLTDEVTLLGGEKLHPCLSRPGITVWTDHQIFEALLKPEVRDMTRRTVGRGI